MAHSMLHKRQLAATPGRSRAPCRRVTLCVVNAAQVIDGKKMAAEIRQEIALEVQKLKLNHALTPGLGGSQPPHGMPVHGCCWVLSADLHPAKSPLGLRKWLS